MSEYNTVKGQAYAVTARGASSVTDENGLNLSVEAGGQAVFVASADKAEVSGDHVLVQCREGSSISGAGGGGGEVDPSNFVSKVEFDTFKEGNEQALEGKQGLLTAGANISIGEDNTISAAQPDLSAYATTELVDERTLVVDETVYEAKWLPSADSLTSTPFPYAKNTLFSTQATLIVGRADGIDPYTAVASLRIPIVGSASGARLFIALGIPYGYTRSQSYLSLAGAYLFFSSQAVQDTDLENGYIDLTPCDGWVPTLGDLKRANGIFIGVGDDSTAVLFYKNTYEGPFADIRSANGISEYVDGAALAVKTQASKMALPLGVTVTDSKTVLDMAEETAAGLSTHADDHQVHVSASDRTTWSGKQDPLTPGDGISISNNTVAMSGTLNKDMAIGYAQEESVTYEGMMVKLKLWDSNVSHGASTAMYDTNGDYLASFPVADFYVTGIEAAKEYAAMLNADDRCARHIKAFAYEDDGRAWLCLVAKSDSPVSRVSYSDTLGDMLWEVTDIWSMDEWDKYMIQDTITVREVVPTNYNLSLNGSPLLPATDKVEADNIAPVSSAALYAALGNKSKLETSTWISSGDTRLVTGDTLYRALGYRSSMPTLQTTISNNTSAIATGAAVYKALGNRTSLTFDSTLSTTSTNPIQNKTVTEALNNKQDKLTAGEGISIVDNTISATGIVSKEPVELERTTGTLLLELDFSLNRVPSYAAELISPDGEIYSTAEYVWNKVLTKDNVDEWIAFLNSNTVSSRLLKYSKVVDGSRCLLKCQDMRGGLMVTIIPDSAHSSDPQYPWHEANAAITTMVSVGGDVLKDKVKYHFEVPGSYAIGLQSITPEEYGTCELWLDIPENSTASLAWPSLWEWKDPDEAPAQLDPGYRYCLVLRHDGLGVLVSINYQRKLP